MTIGSRGKRGEVGRESGRRGEEPYGDEENGGDGRRGEMPFLAHLDELRTRLIRALAAVAVGAFLCLGFSRHIVEFLARPLESLQGMGLYVELRTLAVPEALSLAFKVSLVAGLALSMPLVLRELWLFVSPGLHRGERRIMGKLIIPCGLLFGLGMIFCYLVALPLALRFCALANRWLGFNPTWTASNYFGFVSSMLLAFGLVFQMPVVLTMLAAAEIISSRWLASNRGIAVIVLLTVSALATPPDVASQLLLAVPLMGLYEVSILSARLLERRRGESSEDGQDQGSS